MDHILKALDEHIAYQDFMLNSEKLAREQAEKERGEALESLKAGQTVALQLGAEVDRLNAENRGLKARLADISPTMSREQWDAVMDARDDGRDVPLRPGNTSPRAGDYCEEQ